MVKFTIQTFQFINIGHSYPFQCSVLLVIYVYNAKSAFSGLLLLGQFLVHHIVCATESL